MEGTMESLELANINFKCKDCGRELLIEHPFEKDRYLASSNWLADFDYCLSCMIVHCCQTTCSKCMRVKNHPCSMRSTKEFFLDDND